MVWRLGLLGLSACACWLLAGLWEWQVPKKCEEKFLAFLCWLQGMWPVARHLFRINVHDADLEASFWRVRRSLPGLEKKLRSRVAVQVEIGGAGLQAARRVTACYQRRYPGIEVCYIKENEA